MNVILRKSFNVVCQGKSQLIADITGRPINVRRETDMVYLEFADGAMVLTPEDYLARTQFGDLEQVE